MSASDVLGAIDALVARLVASGWKDRESIKDELKALALEHNSESVRRHLDEARRGLSLELRWEIDEILEALQPPPEPVPEPEAPPEPEPPPSDGRIKMSDLKEIYADPQGNVIYTDKTGKQWFLAQPDPRTGQPVLMRVPPAQIESLKAQLLGSPYWRIGA